MKVKSKYFICFIILTFIFTYIQPNVVFAKSTPEITAPNAVLLDSKTGKVLFDKNAHEKTFPASTTKVLTAILVLENANLDDVVTIDYDLFVDGSSMYLLKGESFTVKELLSALLIRSANDTAEALAIHISGSVEEFAKLMNNRAKELGALNSNFTNPHGLPDENHVTTAYDLAMIANHAMTFDLFREIVSTTMLSFEPTIETPETRIYRNTNRFLWGTGRSNQILYNDKYVNIKYDIIDGVKTGFTNAAKQCLISSAAENDHRLISVVLGAEGLNVYSDSRHLIDYGYENFKLVQLANKDTMQLSTPVKGGRVENVELLTQQDSFALLSIDQYESDIEKNIVMQEGIKAPINKADTLGKVVYSLDGNIIGEVGLISKSSIDVKPFLINSFKPSKSLLGFILIFLLWQLFVAYLRIKKRRRRKMSYARRVPTYNFDRNLFK